MLCNLHDEIHLELLKYPQMFNSYLVLAISTGIEAAVVTRPLNIEAQKCRVIFSLK